MRFEKAMLLENSIQRLFTGRGKYHSNIGIFSRLSFHLDRSTFGFSTASLSRVKSTSDNTTVRRYHKLNGNGHDPRDRLLIVGSGVAGSAAALIAAETYKIPVTMIYAGNVPTDCNSFWAQGGIIYRNFDPKSGDSAELLAQDIHRAGAGLCNPLAVQKVAEEGPDRVRQLLLSAGETFNNGDVDVGAFAQVPFDRTPTGELALCMEASHAAPRILFKADHTGRVITQHITQAALRHPLIQQLPHTIVTDLIVDGSTGTNGDVADVTNNHPSDACCIGVKTFNRNTGEVEYQYGWRGTVLASGGLAGIYEHTTNPAGFNALGSSVALAARHGVACQDLEYVQFHPTALFIPNESRFLLTEALRGEGAVLRDAHGRAFARDYHPDGELAPRDVVARAVFEESQKATSTASHNAFLDITHRDSTWLKSRFPSIQEYMNARGLDLTKDRLPVIPAAHYTCGGITTDLHGCTNLSNLYAAGEAACTGLHGGNRLASASLLEGLVFGASVADHVGAGASRRKQRQLQPSNFHNPGGQPNGHTQQIGSYGNTEDDISHGRTSQQQQAALDLLQTLRKTMWDYVGVVRTPTGLTTAINKLQQIRIKAELLHETVGPTMETTAVRDAAYAGYAVAEAAVQNRISVGAHCIVQDEDSVASSVSAVSFAKKDRGEQKPSVIVDDGDDDDDSEAGNVVIAAAR